MIVTLVILPQVLLGPSPTTLSWDQESVPGQVHEQ